MNDKIHVQGDSFVSLCGRRIGVPGGKIYPGVHVETSEWFITHPYPHVLNGRVCRQCVSIGVKNGKRVMTG